MNDAKLSTRDIAEAARHEDATRDEVLRSETRATSNVDAERSIPPSDSDQHRIAPQEDRDEVSLFPREEADGFRSRWEAIQTGFVDEPKTAVAEADALVAQIVARLAQVFSDEKNTLEKQWDRGDSVSTEDLRVALKRYRAFFHRLLSV